MSQVETPKPTNRDVRRNKNREALIEATLETIAQEGFSGTSVSAIIQRANLSRGMIHLHFGGKDNLVDEAARHSSNAYFDGLESALEQSGSSPQEEIAAVIDNDLSDSVLNERSVRVWYAFRGESRNRAAISRYSDTRDDRLRDLMFMAFEKIVRQTDFLDPPAVTRDVTHGTLALLEGMWTDYLLHPDSFNRESAKRIIYRFLGALFPSSFSENGPRK
ncbi:MAG: TetR family transcriptional regulator C-terminal domain-containing protein [Sulfitobacter sp.]